MFIAFEGPDNTGKSTSAKNLAHDGIPLYNATREMHLRQREEAAIFDEPHMPITYDRIDWFTHMVYRLALPDRNWNDDRPRTVFAMPDTHLVVYLHRPDLADFTAEEIVDTPIARVNPMYWYFTDFFTKLNKVRNYELFKTVSIMEVTNYTKAGIYSKKLVAYSSPTLGFHEVKDLDVDSDEKLLELLRHEDQQRL